MRQELRFALLGLTSVLGTLATGAAAQAPARVSATGQVNIRLVPTRAVIYLLIEATAPTPDEAVARGNQSSTAVVDTLRRVGGADNIGLVQYGVVPTPMTYGAPVSGPPNTFTSRAAVRFTASLAKIPSLTAAAYARGASGSAPPQFQHEGLDSAVTKAIEEATELARQHAEAIAKGLGGQLGPVTNITTQAVHTGMEYSMMQGFPVPQMYDQQSRPLPDIFQSIQVTGSWMFVPRQ